KPERGLHIDAVRPDVWNLPPVLPAIDCMQQRAVLRDVPVAGDLEARGPTIGAAEKLQRAQFVRQQAVDAVAMHHSDDHRGEQRLHELNYQRAATTLSSRRRVAGTLRMYCSVSGSEAIRPASMRFTLCEPPLYSAAVMRSTSFFDLASFCASSDLRSRWRTRNAAIFVGEKRTSSSPA